MVRIAQVSPLYESVPPKLYGGTERVVSYLTEEVVASGHQVTLFASGDSETSASLVPITERSLRLNPHCIEAKGHTVRLVNPLLPHWLPSEGEESADRQRDGGSAAGTPPLRSRGDGVAA